MQGSLRCFIGAWGVAIAVLATSFSDAGQPFRSVPPGGTGIPAVPGVELFPGPRVAMPEVKNPFEGDPQALKQGRVFYHAFNCVGCHFSGGGGIGPPLMDADWIYGGTPAHLFESIAKGRPNGMPAYGHMLPDETIWMIVAYVQSLSTSNGGVTTRTEEGAQEGREPRGQQ